MQKAAPMRVITAIAVSVLLMSCTTLEAFSEPATTFKNQSSRFTGFKKDLVNSGTSGSIVNQRAELKANFGKTAAAMNTFKRGDPAYASADARRSGFANKAAKSFRGTTNAKSFTTNTAANLPLRSGPPGKPDLAKQVDFVKQNSLMNKRP
jgi:hypothetical protein